MSEKQAELRKQIIELLDDDTPDAPQRLRRTAALLESLAAILEELQDNDRAESFSSYGLHAVHYIQEHYHEKLRIADIAGHIGVSRSYLSRLFHEYIGMSPQEYLKCVRMSHAKYRLETSYDSIRDVATGCGYEDALAFSKAFKAHTGYSPTTYRKMFSKMGEETTEVRDTAKKSE